jgi:hypothetical protein
MACLTNPVSQPSLDNCPIWILLIRYEVTNLREDLYNVTDSSYASIGFYLGIFRFYSTDGASSRHYIFSKNFYLIPYIGVHGFGLLIKFYYKFLSPFLS